MDKVTYTQKALRALAWLAEKDHLKAVEVENYRDEADIGWIKAVIHPPVKGYNAAWNRPSVEYKVSPLGHIYPMGSLEAVIRYEDLVA